MITEAAAIVQRARTVWPMAQVPYDQATDHDCSAFVSAVLDIPRQNTVTLVTAGYIRPLAAGEVMRPGDFIGICGPGSEGDAGHIAVVDVTTLGLAFWTIEQHGPDGFLGPTQEFYDDIPDGFLPYRVARTGEEEVKGIIAQAEGAGVLAWTDPLLGPVYRNIVSWDYMPMYVAAGWVTDPDGNAWTVAHLADLGTEVSQAREALVKRLLGDGSMPVSVNEVIAELLRRLGAK